MALKQCPECGGEVSSSAASCPKCGKALKLSNGKKFGIGCGGLLLFGMVLSALGGKGASSTSAGTSLSAAAARAPAQPAVEVGIRELLTAYKGNEVSADARFKDKVISVAGVVDKIGKDIVDSAYVTVGTGEAFEIPVVQCTFARGNEAAAGALQPGQRVVVSGYVKGKMMNIQLSDCQVR